MQEFAELADSELKLQEMKLEEMVTPIVETEEMVVVEWVMNAK